ncbi:tetratricopeptide repeat protein [Granulosicoccus sp. 3-233]|uniref:tetratricopeptide repeat protein n=1 Tax=Granulosicoccus sp. 3-233 TaxID=3417969 RepID=UPI003D32DACD
MSNECNVKDRFFQRLCSGAVSCLLLGCSAVPMSPGTVLAQGGDGSSDPEPAAGSTVSPAEATGRAGQSLMDSQLMFELMIAELAGRRGQLDVAMAGYLRAAQHTDDPRVSERATALALYGQQWAEAEKASRRWQTLEPQSQQASDMLAQSLLQQGKTDEAVSLYRELIAAADDPDQQIRQLHGVLQNAGDEEQALVVMEAMQEVLPDNASVSLALARIRLAGNDLDGARTAAQEALRLDGGSNESLLLNAQLMLSAGEPDEAFAAIESALTDNPNRLMLRLGYARLLLEAGHFDAVGDQLDALYESSGDSPDTLFTISMMALDARRMERAKTYLTSLLETGEYPDEANFYLARISDQQQDHEAAIAFYDAVGAGELLVPAQMRVAELLGLSGDVEAGRARLRALAIEVPDEDQQIQFLSAESRMLQNAGQAAEAVSVLTTGLERYPDDADLLYSRALAADAAGDKSLLESDLEALIAAEPDNAHALNALGYHFADANIELERAEELLVKANRLLPDDPAIMDSLGWLRYRQGRFSEAIELLESAYQLFPDPEIAAHLGEVLWLNGNEQEARSFVDKALASSPGDDRLLQVRKKYIE